MSRGLGVACLLVLTVLAGCHVPGPRIETGPTVTESRSFERSDVEMVKADLEMAAGELRLEGGSPKLFEGEFAYNVPSWKPEIRYDASGFRGRLSIKQSGASGTIGDVKNEWKLRFGGDIPLDLTVRCGAGDNRLDLRTLVMRSVEVHMGAGKVELDLPEKVDRDLDVQVHGGVGQAIVRFPQGVGVVAEAAGGIGEINVSGLQKEDGKWVSEANRGAKATIRIEVKGGIGQIDIRPY